MVVASRRARRACLLALALLAPLSSLAFAESLPVPHAAGGTFSAANLRVLAQRAGIIVAGRIVQVRPGTHPAYPRVGVTRVTVRVTEAFKGAAPGDFTFMQFGHAGDTPPPAGQANFVVLPDLPTYRPGEEILLFLYPPSDAGLTSPVDGARGKWPLTRDPATGQLQVVGMTLGTKPENGTTGPGTAVAGRAGAAASTPYARVRASLRQMTVDHVATKRLGPAGQSKTEAK
jgi:hypothetical protein